MDYLESIRTGTESLRLAETNSEKWHDLRMEETMTDFVSMIIGHVALLCCGIWIGQTKFRDDNDR